MKNRFPFRLGTTSYIIPDNIIPNVRYLAGKVDDIQLLFFESEDSSALPSAEDIATLKQIGDEHGLTYSIHFPLDTVLGAEEPLRSDSVSKHLMIAELTEPLDPSAFIIHLNGDGKNYHDHTPSGDMQRWTSSNRKSIVDLLDAGLDPKQICIETLAYPFSLVEDIIFDHDLSVCLDIGHLIRYGYSVEDHFDRFIERTRSLHVHGIENGKDHKGLSMLAPETLSLVLDNAFKRKDLILTLEVFSEIHLNDSLQTLAEATRKET